MELISRKANIIINVSKNEGKQSLWMRQYDASLWLSGLLSLWNFPTASLVLNLMTTKTLPIRCRGRNAEVSSKRVEKKFSHTTKVLADISGYRRYYGCPLRVLWPPCSTRSGSLLITFSTCPNVQQSPSAGGYTVVAQHQIGTESVELNWISRSLLRVYLGSHLKPFERRNKELQSLHTIIPRQDVTSKQPVGAHKPVTLLTPP